MLSRILDLRPGEGPTLRLLGGHLFLVLAANTLLATAAEAYFLSVYPYSWMPYTYLAGAFWTVVAALLYGKVRARLDPVGVTRVVTIACAAVIAALAVLVWAAPNVGPFVLQMFTPAVGVLGGMESGALVARALESRQARRLYPAISGIGGIGATCGAYSVALLAARFDATVLLGVTVLCLLASMTLATRVRGKASEKRRTQPAPWRDLVAHRFSLLLVLLVFASGALTTSVKFQLSACIKEAMPAEKIAPYLGQLYGALNAVSIVFGFVVTRRLIQWLGVGSSLLVYPGLLLACGLAGVFVPGLVVASSALFFERLFRQNLQRPLLNIATMPLPQDLAARTSVAIRGAVETPAIALTSIALLLSAAHVPWQAITFVVLGAAAAGTCCVLGARRRYKRELVSALHARRLLTEPAANVPLELDGPTWDLLQQELAAAEPARVDAALAWLAGRVEPAMARVVVARFPQWRPATQVLALRVLGETASPEVVQLLAELPADAAPVVRAARFGVAAFRPSRDDYRSAWTESGAAAQAAVARLALDPAGAVDLSAKDVRRWLEGADPEWRAAGVEAALTGLVAGDEFALERLLAVDAEAVVGVASRRSHPELLPYLIESLATDAGYEARRAALLRIGAPAVAELRRVAMDPPRAARALEVLRDLERELGEPVPVAWWIDQLQNGDAPVRYRLLQSLCHEPAWRDTEAALAPLLEVEFAAAQRHHAAQSSEDAIVARQARAGFAAALERFCMMLQLIDPDHAYRRVQLSLSADDPAQRGFAVEALDEMLAPTWRTRLLPLLDSSATEAAAAAEQAVEAEPDLRAIRDARRGAGDSVTGRALALAEHELFAAFGIDELREMVIASTAQRESGAGAFVVPAAGPAELAAALTGSGVSAPPAEGDVALAAIFATTARHPRAAAAWLRGAASVLTPLAPDAADVTHTAVSLASRAEPERQPRRLEDLELWRRMLLLQRAPILSELSASRLQLVATICRPMSVTRGTIVLHEGRPGHHAYLVAQGSFEVSVGDQRQAVLGAGEAFGMLALLSGRPRLATVRALEEGEVLAIERIDLLDLLGTHPGLVRSLSRALARFAVETGATQ